VYTIPHGVSKVAERQERHRPTHEPEILFVGSLTRLKGADLLLRAFSRLGQEGYSARLVIAGSGPEEHRLRRLALRLGVAERVAWLGRITGEEKERVLDSATVIVIPSRWESAPLVIVEAMARRKVIVAPSFMGITSMLSAYPSSHEYTPESIEDLSAKLTAALRQTSDEMEPPEKAPHVISWDAVAELMINAYSGTRWANPHEAIS
jgi:glycosyltransferase involved in cell wall biosynthesis